MKIIVSYFLILILFTTFLNPILAHENDEPQRFLEIGETAPNIELIDQDRQMFSLETAKGKVVLLSFIYTNCPDVCPLQTTKMRQAQDILGDKFGKDVIFISITYDTNDSPEILKEYALAHGADLSGWKFLGSEDEHEIKDAVESLGSSFEKDENGTFAHSMFMYLLDTDLKVNKMYLGSFLDPNEVARDIFNLLPSTTDWTIIIIASILAVIVIVGSIYFYKRK